jgi:hypothetical protein
MHRNRVGALGVLATILAVAAPVAASAATTTPATAAAKAKPKTKVVKSTAKTPAGYRCHRERRHGVVVKVCVKKPKPTPSAPSTSPPVNTAPSASPPPAPEPVPVPVPVPVQTPSNPAPPAPPAPPSTTITATTAVTNWEENGGWATDAFARTVTITQGSPVPAGYCGAPGAPTCWFYTATLSDTGTFTTHSGAARPNTALPGVIAGAVTGSMNGTAHIEFYASSAPSAALVPTAVDTRGPVPQGTAWWPALAFPAGTLFATTVDGDPYAPLVGYSWTYATACDTWHDDHPGSDGHGVGDGNITGICPG